MTTWGDISPRSAQELKDALVKGFRGFAGSDLVPLVFLPQDQQSIAALREKYASDSWNLSL
jgi:hypothetical protein